MGEEELGRTFTLQSQKGQTVQASQHTPPAEPWCSCLTSPNFRKLVCKETAVSEMPGKAGWGCTDESF